MGHALFCPSQLDGTASLTSAGYGHPADMATLEELERRVEQLGEQFRRTFPAKIDAVAYGLSLVHEDLRGYRVVGDEVDAESVCSHHSRECLVGRPPHQPCVFQLPTTSATVTGSGSYSVSNSLNVNGHQHP